MYSVRLQNKDGQIIQLSRHDDFDLVFAGLREGAYLVNDADETDPLAVMYENTVFVVGHCVRIKEKYKNPSEKGKDTTFQLVSLNPATRRAIIRSLAYKYPIPPEETVGLEMIAPAPLPKD